MTSCAWSCRMAGAWLVPLSWFPRLDAAAPEALQRWELLGDGEGIHWPDADEDLSMAGLLAGSPSQGTG